MPDGGGALTAPNMFQVNPRELKPRTRQLLSAVALSTVILTFATAAVAQQKFLILHDLPHAAATPTYIAANHAYLDTLPLDGIAVYGRDGSGNNNISAMVFQPVAVSEATMATVLAPFASLTWTTMKHNFGLEYFGPGWADIYDDTKWAIVAQNAANYAQALNNAGLVGVFFDNENYSRYGNYGDSTCGIPHSLTECQAKIVARGNQVMTAMIAQFPSIVIIFLHDASISDNIFYAQPQFSFVNNVAHANLLVGPFEVGFVQATQGTQALVVEGGENPGYRAHTTTDFNNIYQYQKFAIADGTLAKNHGSSTGAGPNGYIPSALRPLWPKSISAGNAVRDLDNLNPATNLPTTLASTITNALNRADRYVWLYMEVWDGSANPPHPSMLIPPGSAPDAAPQAFVDAVRAGRAAATGLN
jgi:hypothetical protein